MGSRTDREPIAPGISRSCLTYWAGDAGPVPAPVAWMAAVISDRSSSFSSRVAAGDRRAVAGNQERQSVEDAAGERPAAGDRAAQHGAATAGQVTGIGESLGEGHADAGAQGGCGARVKRG
jgi:hypothetical protein